MAKYRKQDRQDVFRTDRRTSLQNRPRPRGTNDVLGSPNPCAPFHQFLNLLESALLGSCFTDKMHHPLNQVASHRHGVDQVLETADQFWFKNRLQRRCIERAGQLRDFDFFGFRRITDVDVEQKTVELRFREGVGSFRIDWILGCKNNERIVQSPGLPRNRHLLFLHRLQQRGLGTG